MVFDFFSGLGLATVLLIFLGILTWLATLEQTEFGLQATLHKYFSIDKFYLVPEINGKVVPIILPSGYWVCALLLVNLILGGIARMRKGWKNIGVLIAHFSMVFLLIAGGVADYYTERGSMALSKGQSSEVAEDYFEYVVEVAEIKDGQPQQIHFIPGKDLTDLDDGKSRIFRLPDLPFDIEIAGYLENGGPVSEMERAPDQNQLTVDGYWLMSRPSEKKAELNTAACYARVLYRDKSKSPQPFILAGASFYPFTIKVDDRTFTFDMHKRYWVVPFQVKLDEFAATFHPGTRKASKFVSDVTRIENGTEAKVKIEMNEPMRYEGLTFYQASYGPQGAGPNDPLYSVLEVVRNPSDQWPKYCLYMAAFGLFVHFITKLVIFLMGSTRKNRHV
ncbi:cytochrome c biogenesis protein ResB [Luteolibacter pohnpeiensis]|uniref:Cytochrome c biogenesis protein ResB n=1 Tax=Luteolibacter pohnpeiensis TaxID=454153 RepID=A0A934VQ64_9BACT|nr:cytochrome c biogenesis protein ResB [Luteolibacter pohnpeiensis]MBK1881781.1 cytochrome c biogenesis protein ResB [Luteolibacter pohnpeiensis]